MYPIRRPLSGVVGIYRRRGAALRYRENVAEGAILLRNNVSRRGINSDENLSKISEILEVGRTNVLEKRRIPRLVKGEHFRTGGFLFLFDFSHARHVNCI